MSRMRRLAWITTAVLCGAGLTGCVQEIAGSPTADGSPAAPSTSVQAAPTTVQAAPTTSSALSDVLVPDVVDDECLLTAAEFGALLGEPVLDPEKVAVKQPDGSVVSSCFVHNDNDIPLPIGRINVYTARTRTALEFLASERGGNTRDLTGVGDAAIVISDGGDGGALHIAAGRYVVTIFLFRAQPSEAMWVSAGRAAVGRLPT